MTGRPDDLDAATSAVRAMVAQWLALSNAVAANTLGPTAGTPPTVAVAVGKLLAAINLPTRADVVAVGAAVVALDARLATIEARLVEVAARLAGPGAGDGRSAEATPRSMAMADLSHVKEHMNVIGADGVHVGTVDKVEGGRIKLTKDSSTHTQHHHFISGGLVAGVEGDDVRLSANGDVAVTFEEEA